MAESEEMGNNSTKQAKSSDNTKLLEQVIDAIEHGLLLEQVIDAIEHGFSERVNFKGSYWF